MKTFPLQEHLPQTSRLVLGCMGLGGGWNHDPIGEAEIAHAQAAVEAALDIGIRLFDHADIYTHGKAEQCLGELLRRQPSLRDQLQIQTKCGIRFGDAEGPKRYDLSAAHIQASVEASLRRLNTEYLDLLLLHRPDPLIEPDEVAEALQRLRASGKLRHWGASNMHAGQMSRLSRAMGEPPRVNQLEMSLLKLDWLDAGTCFNDPQGRNGLAWGETLEFCQNQAVQLQAWGAMARGWLSGAAPEGASAAVVRTAERVRTVALRHGVPPEAVVLAWLMRHPAGIQPVIGTTQPARIRACAQAEQLTLTRGEWYGLYETARGVELP
ncbi:aldo/keto reductase [Inhella proteolytica]|uniref:Aldo/keto reductase n=1 Tax=Inhella proteolytica TaxID=2795029 RepID=A0A931NJK8_9BURK|nr:aldo/keto reductase [Inhella proteolytica]MBH9579124.1 aldo/keto reductase [Inhella proteolytica]